MRPQFERIEIRSSDSTTPKAIAYHRLAVDKSEELSEIVVVSPVAPAVIEQQAALVPPPPVELPSLPELVRGRIVQAPWYQGAVDSTLRLDPDRGQHLREHLSMGTAPPEEYRSGALGFKYALLSISQRKPFLLFGGLLAWFYTLVYWALKLTFLV